MSKGKHLPHFLLLTAGLVVSFSFFVLNRYNNVYQFYSVIGGVFYYISWGVVHHYLEDRLDFYTVSEYVLFGGIVVMLFALVLGV
ncbi:hypothetical protein HY419_01775 [candidate division WWE3 bacterium]|nr:hypothetical protein [candidate division WWE3 bacterium]